MLFAVIAIVALVIVVGGAMMAGLHKRARVRAEQSEAVEALPDSQTLVYALPPGGDTALVVAVLQQHGLTAVADAPGVARVSIACPPDVDREEVRRAIRGTGDGEHEGAPDAEPVVFEDER